MVYAYVTNLSKSIEFNMYGANQFITTPNEYNNIKLKATPEDKILIEEGKLLGSTLGQVLKELSYLVVQNIPFLLLDNPLICNDNEMAIATLSYLATLDFGKETKMGRPEIEVPVDMDKLYRIYLNGEVKKAIELSSLSRATFYRRIAKYEVENGFTKRRNTKAMIYGKTLENLNLDSVTLEKFPLLKL